MTCCLNDTCSKKETCKRYKNEEYAIVNHKANCDEEFEYQWFRYDSDKTNKINDTKEGEQNDTQ